MESDPYLFNKLSKEKVITHLIEQLDKSFWSSYQNNMIHQMTLINFNRGLLEKLIRGLMDIYFKSINYRESDPVMENEALI